jgi:hypothetical protein
VGIPGSYKQLVINPNVSVDLTRDFIPNDFDMVYADPPHLLEGTSEANCKAMTSVYTTFKSLDDLDLMIKNIALSTNKYLFLKWNDRCVSIKYIINKLKQNNIRVLFHVENVKKQNSQTYGLLCLKDEEYFSNIGGMFDDNT